MSDQKPIQSADVRRPKGTEGLPWSLVRAKRLRHSREKQGNSTKQPESPCSFQEAVALDPRRIRQRPALSLQ